MAIYHKCDGNYNQFKEIMNSSYLLDGIDDEVELDDNESYKIAHNIWMDLDLGTESTKEGIFPILSTLIYSKLG